MRQTRKPPQPPVIVEATELGRLGLTTCYGPTGKPYSVRFAPPGARLLIQPLGRQKGERMGRRLSLLRPAQDGRLPRCEAFGQCGGCSLQELAIPAQQSHKLDVALREVASNLGETLSSLRERIHVAATRAAKSEWAYRNKIEFTYGPRRFRSQEEVDRDWSATSTGRFLGFHAPEHFDRVLPIARCEIASAGTNRVLRIAREQLERTEPLPYDPKDHSGFFRHLTIRRSVHQGALLVGISTAVATTEQERLAVHTLANALLAPLTPAEPGNPAEPVLGVSWLETDDFAQTSGGRLREHWGERTLEERLGDKRFEISLGSFFQVNTAATVVLYDTVREALTGSGLAVERATAANERTCVDLYCGTGSIGIYLADAYAQVFGFEELESAVEDARRNATLNGLKNTSFVAGRVETRLTELEDALKGPGTASEGVQQMDLIVDPPRAGMHPLVTKRLAEADGHRLVYVACKPSSLGRDAKVLEAGHWRMTHIWPVDLFPQTPHLELVARFERR